MLTLGEEDRLRLGRCRRWVGILWPMRLALTAQLRLEVNLETRSVNELVLDTYGVLRYGPREMGGQNGRVIATARETCQESDRGRRLELAMNSGGYIGTAELDRSL